MQRLTRRRHLRFLGFKIFRFRQAQPFSIALDELSFCYFARTCGVLRPSTILGTRLLSASIRFFERDGLIMIGSTSKLTTFTHICSSLTSFYHFQRCPPPKLDMFTIIYIKLTLRSTHISTDLCNDLTGFKPNL